MGDKNKYRKKMPEGKHSQVHLG